MVEALEKADRTTVDRMQRARERWGLQDPLAHVDFDGVDLIGEFLEELEQIGRDRQTIKNYKNILGSFQRFLSEERGVHIGKATRQDVLLWKKILDEHGYALKTKVNYLKLLSTFYKFLVENPEYPNNYNPVVKVRRSISLPCQRPVRPEITIEEMGRFVHSIAQPRDRAIIVLLLKTGMRRGELGDLKLSHITLDDNFQGKHPQLKGKPQSVFIQASQDNTKRRMDTVIPIDEECARALRIWLAMREPEDTDKLFLQLTTRKGLDAQRISYLVQYWTERFGWWQKGRDLKTNVTPHYFRHFFTTQMRLRGMQDPVVKYIRGDSAEDIIEVYTHYPWSEIRAQYDRCIYKFGI